MSTEIHVYTGGEDPFETELLGIRLVIHGGKPAGAEPAPRPPQAPDVLVPTQTGSTYRDLRVRDLDDAELRALLDGVENGADLRVHLPSGPSDRLRLDALIAGLTDSQATHLKVHVLPDDVDG
ncbi:hypothetical protein [Pseudactinotalea suaedae]|uniref:hypothetical protein n=1 Tax=Pseudactinotalea suaedae TaxID=1524924 RepID=UPI0012E1D56A|nr:hypothetical protein [Pseudactinotalea suaedae]